MISDAIRTLLDEAWHRGYEASRAGEQPHSPYRGRDMSAEDRWDSVHFEAFGCDSTCCDFRHDARYADMNPYRLMAGAL
jgi:hypothetical protein